MDDDNKVRMTEIFDVTDSESHAMLSIDEVDTNGKLEFDEWDDPAYLSQRVNDGKLIDIRKIYIAQHMMY